MNDAAFLQLMGARVRSELNDLKRTPQACARELGIEERQVSDVLAGKCAYTDFLTLVDKLARVYPIDKSDLLLEPDDTRHGVKIMRATDSAASARIFERADRTGARTPYYEYCDTVMSRVAPFKPEWIRELRVVGDADPANPDVAYNNGHFMHQLTFFIGPVNFYYEVDGRKYCEEMSTGDSNYIMPYFPHSFASRDADQTALIIAVTFGGDVRRAQKELYTLGRRGLKYQLGARRANRQGEVELLKRQLANERMTIDQLRADADRYGVPIDVDGLLDPNDEPPFEQLRVVAEMLGVQPYDLMMPRYRPGHDVLVRRYDPDRGYDYPNGRDRRYRIQPLVRNASMSSVKGFNIDVLREGTDLQSGFETSLHSYVYNYGDAPLDCRWEDDGVEHDDTIAPGDSVYVSPFVRHAFGCSGDVAGRLLVVSVPGAMNLAAQREFSFFADGERVINETRQWFE